MATQSTPPAGAIQKYQTDALQEHIDSTPLLISRLQQWAHAVDTVYNYVNSYVNTQNNVTSGLEKTRKSLADVPQFLGNRDRPQAHPTAASEPSHRAEPPAEVTLGQAFTSLQQRTDLLINDSNKTSGSIKSSIVPNLETLKADIDAHAKTLKSSGQKGMKEVEKAREQTLKLVERLGRLTSSFGTQKLDNKEDPYVIHRQTRVAVIDQINKENVQADAALNVQRSFASLEIHIIEVLQTSLKNLDSTLETFAGQFVQTHSYVSQTFGSIDINKEWNMFTEQNASSLVPSTNYQRDPAHVVFTNSTHPSTVPLIEGTLSRKGTVLKNYSQGYFVLTRSGFLHQFKSKDPVQDATPELSLYLPDSGLGALPARASGDLTFIIISKNAKRSFGQKHKYAFKASNYDELVAWYNAIAGVNGGVHTDDLSPASTPSPASPSSPVVGSPSAFPPAAATPAAATSTTAPAATASATAPAGTVPAGTVPAGTVPAGTAPAGSNGQFVGGTGGNSFSNF